MICTRRLANCAGLLLTALVVTMSFPEDFVHGQDKKKKDAGGPKHVFAGPPPAHPFDVILARPTDKSVTVSVLAYKAMEG